MKSFTPPSRKRFYCIDLSPNTKQILLGSILGDGSLKIAKRYKNARFSEKHSQKQIEYITWKYNMLKPELKGCLSLNKPDCGSYSPESKYIYQSATLPVLTELHLLTHKKNMKRIRRSWLNNLDVLALAVWWCDDGCLNICTQQGELCTDGFAISEIKILGRYLYIDWGIKTVIFSRHKHQRLRFANRENFTKFLRIILPHIPVQSMIYKVMLCCNNLHDQQRWISEVKEALPQMNSFIEDRYERLLIQQGHKLNDTFTCRDLFYPSENDIVQ